MKKLITITVLLFTLIFSNSALSQDLDTTHTVMYEDTTQFGSIEDILRLPFFRDRVVYVDIWGTRCTPCIQEFPYYPELKKKYTPDKVLFLYLKSPYGFDDSKEWKELISKHNVEGIHISMSIRFYGQNFWEKYKDKYTGERSYGIPTYLIINKKGEIVNFDAPRPSKKDELIPLLDREL